MQRHKHFWKSEIILKIHFSKSGFSSLLHPRKKAELIAHKKPEIVEKFFRNLSEIKTDK